MAIIEIDRLTKQYDQFVAVKGLTFDVREGEFFGLLGPNGAGKTTTLLMLTTLLKPTAGTARVKGFDVVREPAQVRRSIGIVFQDPSSDDTLSGYENLKLHALLYGMPAPLREQRIKEVLELVDLTARQHDIVKKYSGGMRRRLELARGLMHRPAVLFLDEPTLGLDPQSRAHIWHYIEGLSREEGISVVITTHYMEEVERLCGRVAIMDEGQVVALDTPDNLKRVIGGDLVLIRARDANLPAIRQVTAVKKVETRNDVVAVTVTDAALHLAEILKVAGPVTSVEVREATLNDVFLHFTGREMREDAPEGGWAERSMRYRSGTR
ncbi:MAG TPA: ATP-binding cassette domain-containing protein [Gemmatimonadales bacterium]|nr:ATP-binding cassette domain-containing protein [Gemmatimonadales bacterium]